MYKSGKCINLSTIAKTAPYYRDVLHRVGVWCMRSFELNSFTVEIGHICGGNGFAWGNLQKQEGGMGIFWLGGWKFVPIHTGGA